MGSKSSKGLKNKRKSQEIERDEERKKRSQQIISEETERIIPQKQIIQPASLADISSLKTSSKPMMLHKRKFANKAFPIRKVDEESTKSSLQVIDEEACFFVSLQQFSKRDEEFQLEAHEYMKNCSNIEEKTIYYNFFDADVVDSLQVDEEATMSSQQFSTRDEDIQLKAHDTIEEGHMSDIEVKTIYYNLFDANVLGSLQVDEETTISSQQSLEEEEEKRRKNKRKNRLQISYLGKSSYRSFSKHLHISHRSRKPTKKQAFCILKLDEETSSLQVVDEEATISSQQSLEEEKINLLKPENKLGRLELTEFVKTLYDEINSGIGDDKTKFNPTSRDAGEEEVDCLLLEENEAALGEQLKKICDDTGREIDPKQSSLIIHELAQLYMKRSPDKLSLIKSAALYNAALIRSPQSKDIEDIEENLQQLCRHILETAGAKVTDADLVVKTNEFKEKVKNMRNKINEKLKLIKQVSSYSEYKISINNQENQKIFDIKSIQKEITSSYSSLMEEISAYCNHVMGDAPCKFAVVGMGSFARKEVTPFSDFEHIILLEEIDDQDPSYESKLEYFRWFSIIFHVIVINLQETILPSVDIACLRKSPPQSGFWFYDHLTNRGISFDGLLPWANKNPLGRQEFTKTKQFKTELIKPVSEMLQYLSSEENLKNGYHLADILTKVSYVYGSKQLFELFKNKMFDYLETKESDEIIKEIDLQLKDDFQNFALRSLMLQLRSSKSFNIKKVIYRSITLFISALGRIYKIRANSCFDIIEKLFEENLISENAKHKLDYAIALACEVRLRWYMQCGRQEDEIQSHSKQESAIEKFMSLLGIESTISYFQIAYALQCDVSKRFNLKPMHFYSDPQLFNHKIIFSLNCEVQTDIMTVTSQSKCAFNQRIIDFDECLSQLEKTIKLKTLSKKENCFDSKVKVAENYKKIGYNCTEQSRYDDAIEFYEMCICILKEFGKIKQQTNLNKMHRHCLYWIGACFHNLNYYKEAIIKCKEAILICKNLPQTSECYREIAKCLRLIGLSFVNIRNQTEALKYCEQSLQILSSISTDIDSDDDISRTLSFMSQCYGSMSNNEDAEKYYQRSMQIKEKKSSNNKPQSDFDNYVDLYNNGNTLYNFNKFHEALESFKKSLEFKQRISIDQDSDYGISQCHYEIGRCLYELKKYDEALESLKKSLDIRERISTDKQTDKDVASTLDWIGQCLFELNEYDEALQSFKKCLDIKERVSIDKQTDQNIALTLDWIAECLVEMNRSNEAERYFEKATLIKQQSL